MRITQLIGLTFAQFTRAVLLAQGDFATFLKSRPSDKAELLEKLTGTDIYSRISIMIYEKSKQAERDYLSIQERIAEISTLSEEQVSGYNVQRSQLTQSMVRLKEEVENITAKLKWYDEESRLQKLVEESSNTLSTISRQLTEAAPRFEYISRIEGVQEIRDTFHQWQTSDQQLSSGHTTFNQKSEQLEQTTLILRKIQDTHAQLEQEWEQLTKEIELIEPQARKARALDAQLTTLSDNVTIAEREYLTAKQSHDRLSRDIETITKELSDAKEEQQRLSAWLTEHNEYRSIVPQTELITSLITDAQTTKKQHATTLSQQKDNESRLADELSRFTRLQERSELLNRQLPTEIALWRSQLRDGEACPVCGSLHHPVQTVDLNHSLQEVELTKAKQEVSTEIAVLSESIETRKAEITRLTTRIEYYAESFNNTKLRLKSLLSGLPSWEDLFERGTLQRLLTDITMQWTAGSEKLSRCENLIQNKHSVLQTQRQNLQESVTNLTQKETRKAETLSQLSAVRREREGILGGQSVDALSMSYGEKRKALNARRKKCDEELNEATSSREKLFGATTQLATQIAQLTAQNNRHRQQIDHWISTRETPIDIPTLKELLNRDSVWLQSEKRELTALREQETGARATLSERQNSLMRHNQVLPKPAATETRELLSNQSASHTSDLERYNKQIIEIELSLRNHFQNIDRIKAYEQSLSVKRELSSTWEKLNALFGSASGNKFKEIAQGYTLEALLTYANHHLRDLSRRYELQRIPDTLALQVIDLEMLGEIRTVHSLSGGESFLLSLALALGLSSLSSSRMKIESLFIDEGFGALDAETLRTAMDALERLQTQGRKIGVISHVTEMTERISTRICVTKTSNGRSVVSIKKT